MLATTNHGFAKTLKHFGCMVDDSRYEIALVLDADDRQHLIQIRDGKWSGLNASNPGAAFVAGRQNAIDNGIDVVDFA